MSQLEASGHIDIDPKMFPNANFALKITGDVIIKSVTGIHDGDIAIIKTTKTLEEGEFCAVLHESKTSFLPYEKGVQGQILGKVIGLIRVY